jgi:hypothetical protein
VPVALSAQGRQHGLGDVEDAEQVDLELVAQLLLGDLLDNAEEPIACVVDHDVQPSEVGVRLVDRGEDPGAVGHVELQRQHHVAERPDQVVDVAELADRRGHLVATAQRGLGELLAEPAPGAGDEPDLGHACPLGG